MRTLHGWETPDKEIAGENFIKSILAGWDDDSGVISGGGRGGS